MHKGPHTGAGGGLLSLRRKQLQKTCDELAVKPMPHFPVLCGNEVGHVMEGGCGEGGFMICFTFHYLSLILVGNTFN